MDKLFERITLPSLGQCYHNSLSSGKVNLYPLTTKHEDFLCSSTLKSDYSHFDILLSDVIQNKDVDVNSLLQCDVEGILLALRILAYGSKNEVSIKCPSCEYINNHILNLLAFSPIERTIPVNRIYIHNQYTIYYNLYTYGVFKSSSVSSQFLYNIIDKVIDTNQNEEIDKSKFISQTFLYKDYKKFIKFYHDTFPHISPYQNIKCDSCGHTIKIPFKVDQNFFGFDHQYKMNLHKEIFKLAYLSQGGLSYSEIYDLPINQRMIYTKELVNIQNEQKNEMDKSSKTSPSISRPNISSK